MIFALIAGIAILSSVVALANEPFRVHKEKQFRFGYVGPCNEFKAHSGLCISGTEDYEPSPVSSSGQLITILADKGDGLCYAKSGRAVDVISSIGDQAGNKLTGITCKQPLGEVAVAGYVKIYRKLNFKPVKDEAFISAIDGRIRKKGLLNIFYRSKTSSVDVLIKRPEIFQYPFPGKKVYFALYKISGDTRILIMSINDQYKVLSDIKNFKDGWCMDYGLDRAFLLNGKYYVWFSWCVCETDGCGDEIIEIK
ncbi:MAG: hypothetical protein M0Z52_01115 [Actinomycetota bacterium]|nr:hypothetical protein [Actinomycetota bacterium]